MRKVDSGAEEQEHTPAMEQTTAAQQPVRYVVARRMIDCTGAAPVQDPVIVVEGGRIREIGTRATIGIPREGDVLDCGTATLMPGMLDIHIHTMMFNCLTFHNFRV